MEQYSTLESILIDRAACGLTSILDELYAHAYCAGAGIPCEVAHSEPMLALIGIVEQRHYERVLRVIDPPMLADELPGWFFTLRQQADTIEGPPVEGWPI